MVYVIKENNTNVKEILVEKGIKFETFDTTMEAFLNDEAAYRLEHYENDNKCKFTEESKEFIQNNLSQCFYEDNERIINSDYIYNETDDIVNSSIKHCESINMKVFMTRE